MLLQSAAKNEIPFRDALLDSPADFFPPSKLNAVLLPKTILTADFLRMLCQTDWNLLKSVFYSYFIARGNGCHLICIRIFRSYRSWDLVSAFLLHTVWLTVIYNILIWGTLISRCKTISNQHLYFFPSPFLPQFWINLVERNGKKTWISA